MHLAVQALSLASLQPCHLNKGNKYFKWTFLFILGDPGAVSGGREKSIAKRARTLGIIY